MSHSSVIECPACGQAASWVASERDRRNEPIDCCAFCREPLPVAPALINTKVTDGMVQRALMAWMDAPEVSDSVSDQMDAQMRAALKAALQ